MACDRSSNRTATRQVQAALDPRDPELDGRGERVQMNGLKATDWCANCIFWNESGPKSSYRLSAECRRYPPRFNSVGERVQWPLTGATDWCGEQRQRRPT